MRNLKKNLFLTFVLCFFNSVVCNSQTSGSAIPMPTQQNKIIIDKIVEAAHYKTYVIDYCLSKITETSAKEGWNDQKTMEITASINYKNFKDAIYNSFAFYNEIELETLLKTYEKDIIYQKTNVMTANKILSNNLSIFANDIAQGKYISK